MFDQVLTSYYEFYRVLPSFSEMLTTFIQFFRVLPGFTEFYWVLLGFSWMLPGFTGFYLDLLAFTGFYRVLLGFTGFYWVLLGFTGFYWVLPRFVGERGVDEVSKRWRRATHRKSIVRTQLLCVCVCVCVCVYFKMFTPHSLVLCLRWCSLHLLVPSCYSLSLFLSFSLSHSLFETELDKNLPSFFLRWLPILEWATETRVPLWGQKKKIRQNAGKKRKTEKDHDGWAAKKMAIGDALWNRTSLMTWNKSMEIFWNRFFFQKSSPPPSWNYRRTQKKRCGFPLVNNSDGVLWRDSRDSRDSRAPRDSQSWFTVHQGFIPCL